MASEKNATKKSGSASAGPARPRRLPAAEVGKAAVATAAPEEAWAKPKLIRDSFTIPKYEYAILQGLKDRAANLKRPVKKSELLRAGVATLHAMSDRAFLAALKGTPSLKTGRPGKGTAGATKPA